MLNDVGNTLPDQDGMDQQNGIDTTNLGIKTALLEEKKRSVRGKLLLVSWCLMKSTNMNKSNSK